MNEMSYI